MESIRNFFHTETWWGKTIFIILVYVFYWFLFYGFWFIIPPEYFDHNTDISGILFLAFNFIIIPVISFFIPYFLIRLFTIDKTFLYVLHVFLVLLSLGIFSTLAVISAFSNFTSIG